MHCIETWESPFSLYLVWEWQRTWVDSSYLQAAHTEGSTGTGPEDETKDCSWDPGHSRGLCDGLCGYLGGQHFKFTGFNKIKLYIRIAVPAGCHHWNLSKLRSRDHYGAETCRVLWRWGAHSILRWWRIDTVLRWWRIHTVLKCWGFHPILSSVKSTWGETIMVSICCPRDRDRDLPGLYPEPWELS